ncbi:unnamed protein product [Symbiodinium sp. CCMP2456]|nr:unnamed protein product [Symbiodinium sp. CCMP2456]
MTWTVSLPATASVASFACFSVSLNMGLKWMCQRPRPIWLDDGRISDVWNIGSLWEADYAFPSGHTHVLSGILVCIFFAYELPPAWLYVMYLLGALAGFSRNYLGVHWCSDTATGFIIGCVSGTLWGLLDVYGRLMRRGDPLLSVCVGLGAALGMTLLTLLGRAVTKPVQSELRAEWQETAVQGLQSVHPGRPKILPRDTEADSTPSLRTIAPRRWSCCGSRPRRLRPRRLVYTAGPALCGGLCLAMSGIYSRVLPATELGACLSFHPPMWTLLLRMAVGLGGAGVLALLLLLLPRHLLRHVGCLDEKHRAKRQVILLFPLSLFALWTFAGAPVLFEACKPAYHWGSCCDWMDRWGSIGVGLGVSAVICRPSAGLDEPAVASAFHVLCVAGEVCEAATTSVACPGPPGSFCSDIPRDACVNIKLLTSRIFRNGFGSAVFFELGQWTSHQQHACIT